MATTIYLLNNFRSPYVDSYYIWNLILFESQHSHNKYRGLPLRFLKNISIINEMTPE
jgi:hypothetical protein